MRGATHNRRMMTALLFLHIAAGSIALASMWIPLVSKKGGRAHRRAGWVFVTGMTVVSITALLLSGARFLFDSSSEARAAGMFLFYVAIISAAGVSAGVRVLRAKRRTARHRKLWDLGMTSVLVAGSVAMAIYSISAGRILFMAFSIIGLVIGGGQLAYWLRVPSHPMHWWFEHMGNMLGSCIAATTAFLVVNADRWGVETFSLEVWLAPTIIGTPIIVLWTAYYRRKFAQTQRTAVSA